MSLVSLNRGVVHNEIKILKKDSLALNLTFYNNINRDGIN